MSSKLSTPSPNSLFGVGLFTFVIIDLYSLFLITLVVFEMYKNCLFYSTNKLVVFVRRGIALY